MDRRSHLRFRHSRGPRKRIFRGLERKTFILFSSANSEDFPTLERWPRHVWCGPFALVDVLPELPVRRTGCGTDLGPSDPTVEHADVVSQGKDQRTQDYVVKRTSEGKGKKEIMRCLKRYVAREIYRVLQNPRLGLLTNDLRPRCLALHLTQTAVALELSAWPKAISRIERDANQDRVLSERYRTWLSEQPKISA